MDLIMSFLSSPGSFFYQVLVHLCFTLVIGGMLKILIVSLYRFLFPCDQRYDRLFTLLFIIVCVMGFFFLVNDWYYYIKSSGFKIPLIPIQAFILGSLCIGAQVITVCSYLLHTIKEDLLWEVTTIVMMFLLGVQMLCFLNIVTVTTGFKDRRTGYNYVSVRGYPPSWANPFSYYGFLVVNPSMGFPNTLGPALRKEIP